MGQINVLDFQVANLIAAGEVVERPASAVKELIENAVDAGAKNVTVEIKRGGISFIRVTDDGCGMDADDLPVAILRHATSKIKDASDLDGITTLGFRGEALAAIASVSRLRIMSRRKRKQMGTSLEALYGEIIDLSESGMPEGTTVIVEELFANVPARRKFLKRDASEAMACAAVAEKAALANPKIAIKFISDGTMKFSTSGDGKLKNAIYSVLGREFASKMTEVRDMSDGISVSGYISRPDSVRANRNFENFFINGRYVKSRTAMSALEQAYESFIPSEKFPCCVLNIDIHPTFVDVNVHPTKLEVKFSNERLVFDAVYSAVRNTLLQKLDRPALNMNSPSVSAEDIALANAFVPIFDHKSEPPAQRYQHATIFDSSADEPEVSVPRVDNSAYDREQTPAFPWESGQEKTHTYTVDAANLTRAPETVTQYTETQVRSDVIMNSDLPRAVKEIKIETSVAPKPVEYRIIGEAFNSYVIVEVGEKVLIIDKHAAHERINFERMKRNLNRGGGETQMLLAPIEMMLDPQGYSAVKEHSSDLSSLGYELIFDDGRHTVGLAGYPAELEEESACDLIDELCDKLTNGSGTVRTAFDSLLESALYQASCKASIKAGHIEDEGHIKWICDNLLALPDIKFCPHGRPVAMELTKSEIEKQFKRS